jgi:hypothetical protein
MRPLMAQPGRGRERALGPQYARTLSTGIVPSGLNHYGNPWGRDDHHQAGVPFLKGWRYLFQDWPRHPLSPVCRGFGVSG